MTTILAPSSSRVALLIGFLWLTQVGQCSGQTLATEQPSERYQPAWSLLQPERVIRHAASDAAKLTTTVAALKPGEMLELASGTYTLTRKWDINVSGTPSAPIWIVAAAGAKVSIHRADDRQNVINIGTEQRVSHLCLRGLEITGGSHGIRLGQCDDVCIDQCHIHHTADVCLSANSASTHRLYLTRNHLHDGGGHGEGMYLGANHGQYVMSESVIALNHIHDCRGDQGDGIEVKQGSWGNLIAENHVHDTHYPCITVYGTAGRRPNVIERNLCYRSDDHCMQVQGEAIVRNNVLIASQGAAFATTDHQGKTRQLQFVHNTVINIAHAFSGSSWNDREGMTLANNLLYSRDENAMNFPNGSGGVTIAGNVVFGSGEKHGSALGRGLSDFCKVTWDANLHDATPTLSAPIEQAVPQFLLETDFNAAPRTAPTSGAIHGRKRCD